MDTLAPLIASLRHELGLTDHEAEDQSVRGLKEFIIEEAVAAFVAEQSEAAAATFFAWVDAHQFDADIMPALFVQFPRLLECVHLEMVETIASAKKEKVLQ